MTKEEFRTLRKKLGLKRPELAAVLETDTSALSRWESGDRKIPGPVAVLVRWLTTGRKPTLPT